MNNKSLVSVIIIFLNAERFLQEAIESVLAQTYNNWALLLVDDGSTDASTGIARRYAAQYPNQVHYLEHRGHQNRGKGASRNLGIHHAQGEYIAFLDADDVWLPHKLEEQTAILDRQTDAAMLYGDTEYWYDWTDKPEDVQRNFVPKLGVKPNTLIEPPTLLPLFLRGKVAVPCTCSILVRRDVLVEVGGFDDSFQDVNNIYEDQAFYAKICLKAPIMAVDRCWDKYRQHPEASVAIAQNTGQEYLARQFFLKWLADYLTEQGSMDAEVWQALRKEFWLRSKFHLPTWFPLPERTQYFIRWIKKWLLRLEELILPASLRLWIWTRNI